ncbi:MAG: hypothetical protein IKS14_02620, partial [Thermoguttaceae bacterium]|nr:hypothetical protein [Thermoguttaceae bacterium]
DTITREQRLLAFFTLTSGAVGNIRNLLSLGEIFNPKHDAPALAQAAGAQSADPASGDADKPAASGEAPAKEPDAAVKESAKKPASSAKGGARKSGASSRGSAKKPDAPSDGAAKDA